MKTLIIVVILTIITNSFIFSQEECFVVYEKNTLLNQEVFPENTELNQESINIRLTIHIVSYSNGTGSLPLETINLAIAYLNSYFYSSNIMFEIKNIFYIYSDTYANIDDSTEARMLLNMNNVYGNINIYFVPNAIFRGAAKLPGISCIIRNDQALTSTIAHEIGHNLWLFHTHETKFGRENITRIDLLNCSKNCDRTGDLLCDTPADPTLNEENVIFDTFLGICLYKNIKNVNDSCGNTNYSPDLENLMSGNPYDECRRKFTRGQINRMKWALNTHPDLQKLLEIPIIVANKINSSNVLNSTLTVDSNVVNSGDTLFLRIGREYGIKTNHERFKQNNIIFKHSNWNENINKHKLFEKFTINEYDDQIIANFIKLDTVSIVNELIDAQSVNGGNVLFKDPWYLHSNNTQPDSFISFSSPFKPTGAYNQTAGGVFLNQGGPDPNNLTPPYYSVRVPIYQWIGNFYSQFEEWQATGATLREIYDLNVPGYSTRAVVFKSSDAKVTAKYCAITASLDAQIMSGWNLVSIPINIASTPASQIYPDATSYVFGFENGTYVPKSTLKSGEGYWVRFANAHTKNYSGQPMFSTTIPVKSGWNLVGSISIPISINKTRTEPEGKRISPFYKNSSGGYVVADTIKPGEGYWVKMQSDCNLLYNIAPPQQGPGYEDPIIADVLNNSDRFIVSDAEGNTQELYVYTGEANLEGLDLELPPAPPEGAIFNVRFATDRMIEVYDETAEENNFIIEVNTENYPVTVEWEINSENGIEYTVGYSSGGYGKTNYRQLDEKNGKIILPTKGNERISLLTGKVKSRVVPKEYSLKQNRPNPFNPITSINFALPVAGHTTLKIYDVLGREVAVLVNEYKEAGVYEVVWDASAQPSGVYFYKLQSGNFIAVKKMLLVR